MLSKELELPGFSRKLRLLSRSATRDAPPRFGIHLDARSRNEVSRARELPYSAQAAEPPERVTHPHSPARQRARRGLPTRVRHNASPVQSSSQAPRGPAQPGAEGAADRVAAA